MQKLKLVTDVRVSEHGVLEVVFAHFHLNGGALVVDESKQPEAVKLNEAKPKESLAQKADEKSQHKDDGRSKQEPPKLEVQAELHKDSHPHGKK